MEIESSLCHRSRKISFVLPQLLSSVTLGVMVDGVGRANWAVAVSLALLLFHREKVVCAHCTGLPPALFSASAWQAGCHHHSVRRTKQEDSSLSEQLETIPGALCNSYFISINIFHQLPDSSVAFPFSFPLYSYYIARGMWVQKIPNNKTCSFPVCCFPAVITSGSELHMS